MRWQAGGLVWHNYSEKLRVLALNPFQTETVIFVAILKGPTNWSGRQFLRLFPTSSLCFGSKRHKPIKVLYCHLAGWVTTSHIEIARCSGANLFNCGSTSLCTPRHAHPPLVCGSKQARSVLCTWLIYKQEINTWVLCFLLTGEGQGGFRSGRWHLLLITSLINFQTRFACSALQRVRAWIVPPFWNDTLRKAVPLDFKKRN